MAAIAVVVSPEDTEATAVTANDVKKPVVVDGGEVAKNAAATGAESQKKKAAAKNKTRIQVSNTKRPFVFYFNLAKKYIKQYNSVELSALGMAIPTVISIAETLKSTGLAVEKNVSTSTFCSKLEGEDGRKLLKPQIAILLDKAERPKETPPVPFVATEV